jgi:hypothetical protein
MLAGNVFKSPRFAHVTVAWVGGTTTYGEQALLAVIHAIGAGNRPGVLLVLARWTVFAVVCAVGLPNLVLPSRTLFTSAGALFVLELAGAAIETREQAGGAAELP